ncbi:MAG: 2-isopropylmalate synthase, partial [Caldiserica bacterium]
MRKILIFDTTLRDGEQTPGVSLDINDKIEIACALEELGVDYIEAGFPITSRGDFEAVKEVSRIIKNSGVCGLARAVKKDIEVCWEAIKIAKRPRIHTFIATSHVHMKYKLRMKPEEVIDRAKEAVRYAKKFTSDVEFSCEDAARSDRKFLIKIINEVIKEGATTINIPDTVGYAIPQEFYELIFFIKENLEKEVTISVHCHNDLGLATANSLSAVLAGASQVECTINGLGERAGNASLEEIVMSLKARRRFFKAYTGINTRKIMKVSKIVSRLTGINPQPNKAIVGANAFAHESGIHQDGVIKKRTTYEIINPRDIGLKESKIVFGKHSGRHAIEKKLNELGYKVNKKMLDEIFVKFKEIADKK